MKMRWRLYVPLVLMSGVVLLAPFACPEAVAANASRDSIVRVSLRGTVDGPPESVAFSGQAQIKAKVIGDSDLGAPARVLLSIDLSKMVGIGSSTGKRYVTSTQEILNRPLSVADLFEVTFSFVPSDVRGATARVGMVFFNLGFDMTTGEFIGAAAEVASPDFPENDERGVAVHEDDSALLRVDLNESLP